MQRSFPVTIALLFVASTAFAQGGPPAGGQGGARQGGAPAGPVGLAAGLQASYNRAKGLVMGSANEMPEDGFSHKPGDAPRTFANIFAHIADANYNFCSQGGGVPNPRMGQSFEMSGTVVTKADALKVLQDVYAFCDPVFAALTDASMAEQIMGGRGGSRARGSILAGVTEHDNEMYGISTVYLRTNGRVPPASQGRGRGGAGGRGAAPAPGAPAPPAGGRGQ